MEKLINQAQNSPMVANPYPFPVSQQTYERKRKGFLLIISANSPPLQIFFRRRLA
jgi:hypothetical protein